MMDSPARPRIGDRRMRRGPTSLVERHPHGYRCRRQGGEGGPDESELIRKLKIEGFPALVIIPESPGPPVHLAPFPGGEALSTSEFLQQLKGAAR